MKRAKEHAIPVRIAGVAVGANQYDIINLPVFANSLGFSEVRIDVIRNVGSGADPALMPSNPEVLSKKWLTTPVFEASRIDYEHNRFWNPCWAGKLSISSTGEVLPCIMGRNEVIGNVKDDGELQKTRLKYVKTVNTDMSAAIAAHWQLQKAIFTVQCHVAHIIHTRASGHYLMGLNQNYRMTIWNQQLSLLKSPLSITI